MSSVADKLSAFGARIGKPGISKIPPQPGFNQQNLLSLHDICPREMKTDNEGIAHCAYHWKLHGGGGVGGG